MRSARRQGLAQHQRFTPVLGCWKKKVYHTPKRIKPRNPYAGENVARVPLLGRVTAGKPILAVEEVEEYVPYSGGGYNPGDLFALRVMGDSMINAGIFDGDVVIVRKTSVAENGEIVVALIGDEATVKRIYRENGHIRLQPENDEYEPIIVDEAIVLGRVVSLLRYF